MNVCMYVCTLCLWGLVSNLGPPNFQSIHLGLRSVRVSLGLWYGGLVRVSLGLGLDLVLGA